MQPHHKGHSGGATFDTPQGFLGPKGIWALFIDSLRWADPVPDSSGSAAGKPVF